MPFFVATLSLHTPWCGLPFKAKWGAVGSKRRQTEELEQSCEEGSGTGFRRPGGPEC